MLLNFLLSVHSSIRMKNSTLMTWNPTSSTMDACHVTMLSHSFVYSPITPIIYSQLPLPLCSSRKSWYPAQGRSQVTSWLGRAPRTLHLSWNLFLRKAHQIIISSLSKSRIFEYMGSMTSLRTSVCTTTHSAHSAFRSLLQSTQIRWT